MSKQSRTLLAAGLALILALLACTLGERPPTSPAAENPPSNSPSPSLELASSEIPSETQPAPTAAPALTPTPQNPLVTTTAYCWSGPESKTLKYEIISSIQAGTRVQLLGRGVVDGWWVVKNPRYNDPCWIQQEYVQIDPSYDLSGLKVFSVPATPTATP